MRQDRKSRPYPWLAAVVIMLCAFATNALAVPLPGGTLNPLDIPKYVTPLVIPPAMAKSSVQPEDPSTGQPTAVAADYNIAVREFKQQILPSGFGPTKVWSYGLEEEQIPTGFVAPRPGYTLNYPAFTIENTSNMPTTVRWINDLRTKNPDGTYSFLPHLFAVDQTLHWANPPNDGCIKGNPQRTECRTNRPEPYQGPVPIVTHVHGAHVNPESDGYPEAWWLPDADDVPATYAKTGKLFTEYDINSGQANDFMDAIRGIGRNQFNPIPGSAFYSYENDQPATTLWYHDHSLGMTRLNVYAGPAGFWMIRGDFTGTTGNLVADSALDAGREGRFKKLIRKGKLAALPPAKLPGPYPMPGMDPNFIAADRAVVRDIPIVIQDRSFNIDGSLFYPDNYAFFHGLNDANHPAQLPGAGVLDIPYIGDKDASGNLTNKSDMAPIWNPEAFFNTMVVNGTTWPTFKVAPAKYRFRLLNGTNSRFLNLSMFVAYEKLKDKAKGEPPKYQVKSVIDPVAMAPVVTKVGGKEVPIYQIGGDQGFLPNVVEIRTGKRAVLAGNGRKGKFVATAPAQALLMSPAERADVIIDFSKFKPGTVIRMLNTGPDAPFGGFPAAPMADLQTTGQVMEFVVTAGMLQPATDPLTTDPYRLVMSSEGPLAAPDNTRKISLNEEHSTLVCVDLDPITGSMSYVGPPEAGNHDPITACTNVYSPNSMLMAPKAALLGTFDPATGSIPLTWSQDITENPNVGDTEVWEVHNFTVDAHPIHVHLVRYQAVDREPMVLDLNGNYLGMSGLNRPPEANETGYKDTIIAYPGEVTRFKAKFDKEGLYVWHCHIVEHEDNEMMRPYYVGKPAADFPVKIAAP